MPNSTGSQPVEANRRSIARLLRNRLQHLVDGSIFRQQPVHREQLKIFSRELARAADLPAILRVLRQAITTGLAPGQLHIFIYDPSTDAYQAVSDPALTPARPSSDLRFSPQSALVKVLDSQSGSIQLKGSRTIPTSLKEDQVRIALLGCQVFTPMPGRQQLAGWVAIQPSHADEPFRPGDIEFLEAICGQAALAIEHSQVVSDLEHRVHAMNVLTRVSQGINITLAFDDILELIYTQTNSVLPARDFHICLYDSHNDLLYSVFHLENDERITERENIPIPPAQGLEWDVLTSRQGLATDDYDGECRRRSRLPLSKGLLSWLGVPLNSGAETMGVLSLASRDSTIYFTAEQINLLQAVADQAAGAIVKARLLQEAERRTRQLTSLNEVTRSLTSTLELDPLLNQILTNAVDILNCEAGSLLLLETTTGELIFEVAVGPVGADLTGKRLPAGAGIAGKAVESRQPIIQNDVHRSDGWFSGIQTETGFVTRDILVVPMLVKDQCLGVIEVINRKDGFPFTQDDQELLMAFASQAGVALENARLYTQTDQSLAARVEELSVMQRIDRELNASLDVSRTMHITLDWAIRQSRTEAGLAGILDGEFIHVMVSQGYKSELEIYPDQNIPAEMPAVLRAVETGQPQVVRMDAPGGQPLSRATLLADGQAQVVVPIRREAEVIGLLILESLTPQEYPDEMLAFLSRLSDHAAIAISNAQLYAVVQAANLAKSEFVSFVSHELKTPMTSIRGFTDLLASGVVGEVNPAQSNFLQTIRSNVDRMATLVSDLADVSRIEANRLRLDFQAVELADLLDEVVRSSHTQIEAKLQTLQLNIPADLPNLWGDRFRVIQILTNLVNNAHKYTPQGGKIQVTAELADNIWDADGAAKVLHISVQDNGIGISLENQSKIFQKFFRADDQQVRDIPGTGLGLNITRTLVEMQGGKIWFDSQLRTGTTFHFTIPTVESA